MVGVASSHVLESLRGALCFAESTCLWQRVKFKFCLEGPFFLDRFTYIKIITVF